MGAKKGLNVDGSTEYIPDHAISFTPTSISRYIPLSSATSYPNLPIGRLPFELLLIMFHYCSVDLKDRLVLTNVCRYWRSAALEDAWLWTYVCIPHYGGDEEVYHDGIFSMLEIQLDRTKEMPLDVVWTLSELGRFNRQTIDLFHHRAPFSRWRSLTLDYSGNNDPPHATLDFEDSFQNLEYIKLIISAHPQSIMESITRTTTSKLKTLDLSTSTLTQSETKALFSGLFSHITSYYIPCWEKRADGLPRNVVNLGGQRCDIDILPHVQTCTTQMGVIRSGLDIKLDNLTSLTIHSRLYIMNRYDVNIPSLRYLKCPTIFIPQSANFTTPLLDTFHMGTIDVDHTRRGYELCENSIQNGSFQAFPKNTLIIDLFISEESILRLLRGSPDISYASLSFIDEAVAIQVIQRIEGDDSSRVAAEASPIMYESNMELGERPETALCAELSELRFNFGWPISNVDIWKSRVVRLVDERSKLGIALAVYASWKGEGTFVRLA